MLKLSAAPLLEFVEGRGGLASLFQITEYRTIKNQSGESKSVIAMQVVPEELKNSYESYYQQYLRIKSRGWVGFYWADDFCCKWLRIHPCAVFGEEWWEVARAKGRGPGTNPPRWRNVTDDQVRALRREYEAGGVTQLQLSERHGISRAHVGAILRREHYADVD